MYITEKVNKELEEVKKDLAWFMRDGELTAEQNFISIITYLNGKRERLAVVRHVIQNCACIICPADQKLPVYNYDRQDQFEECQNHSTELEKKISQLKNQMNKLIKDGNNVVCLKNFECECISCKISKMEKELRAKESKVKKMKENYFTLFADRTVGQFCSKFIIIIMLL